MELHHKKHHQTYITNLNAVEETLSKLQLQTQTPSTVKEIIALQPTVRFNGGGHINHSLFWKNLCPAGSPESKLVEGGKFAELVSKDFGGIDGLKKEVNAKTAAIQGSGWGWVVSPDVPWGVRRISPVLPSEYLRALLVFCDPVA
jgi:Fe-Mn family superoxide dismutase